MTGAAVTISFWTTSHLPRHCCLTSAKHFKSL